MEESVSCSQCPYYYECEYTRCKYKTNDEGSN